MSCEEPSGIPVIDADWSEKYLAPAIPGSAAQPTQYPFALRMLM